jgi:hypothetical protein
MLRDVLTRMTVEEREELIAGLRAFVRAAEAQKNYDGKTS